MNCAVSIATASSWYKSRSVSQLHGFPRMCSPLQPGLPMISARWWSGYSVLTFSYDSPSMDTSIKLCIVIEREHRRECDLDAGKGNLFSIIPLQRPRCTTIVPGDGTAVEGLTPFNSRSAKRCRVSLLNVLR